jgi:hypothetical protein
MDINSYSKVKNPCRGIENFRTDNFEGIFISLNY